jgi:hypothetical protein
MKIQGLAKFIVGFPIVFAFPVSAAQFVHSGECTWYKQEKIIKISHYCAVDTQSSQGCIVKRLLWDDNTVMEIKNIETLNPKNSESFDQDYCTSIDYQVNNKPAVMSNFSSEYLCYTFLTIPIERICIKYKE